jgi:hypothetical protein
MPRELWYDKEKAPRLYAGWRAMLETLDRADGEEWFVVVLTEMVETGLASSTARMMIVDARVHRKWIGQEGRKGEVKLRLTEEGRAMV